MDDDERRALDDIAEYGWHSIAVDKDHHGPAFEYSVGFMETCAHPEVIIFGLPTKLMHSILWGMFREIQKGNHYREGGLYQGLLEGYPCAIRPMHAGQYPLYLGYAMWHRRYCGKVGSLQAFQCVYPDMEGIFPFEKGCNPKFADRQPLLSEPPLTI